MGWRYFLYTMGGINFVMFIRRFFVFHLYESPKYLMGRGRDEEAVQVLRHVAVYNGRIYEPGSRGNGWFGRLFNSHGKMIEEEIQKQNAFWEARLEAVREELRAVDRSSGGGRDTPT